MLKATIDNVPTDIASKFLKKKINELQGEIENKNVNRKKKERPEYNFRTISYL